MWLTLQETRRSVKYLRYILLAGLLLLVLAYQTLFIVEPAMDSMDFYKELSTLEEVEPLQACQLPLHHPFEPSLLSYFKSPRPISCRSRVPLLTFIDESGILRYNETAFSEAGYSISSLSCVFQEITRIEGRDDKVSFGEEKTMTGNDRPSSDFVYVACSRSRWLPKVYSMYHAHTQPQPHVRHFRDDEELGVAVVGLDSVSRLNFMRQLPRSYKAITESLGGTVLRGLNKVGENTFPNVVPILTGNPPQPNSPSTFDDWPFLWTPLNKDGMATLYGEDLSRIMTFSWWGDGFQHSPTTHYFRPFWIAVDSSSLDAWSSPLCLGPVPKHRLYLDYLKSFLRTYRRSPVFMFSLENEPSHDYLNTVGVMDEDLEQFLLSGHSEGLFNRTVLLVLSDHGHRFDVFRNTKQGKIEDSMPMVSIILPEWYKAKYPRVVQTLQDNAGRLTSSYDLYSTFADIFTRGNSKLADESEGFVPPLHGQSLLQPVSLERTCKQAGVPEMYCVCREDTEELELKELIVERSLKVLMDFINQEVLTANSQLWNTSLSKIATRSDLLDQQPSDTELTVLKRCAPLEANVKQADLINKPDGRRLVHVTWETSPNDGVYEGRVEWDGDEGRVHEEIIRINRYGNQADCLPRLLMTLVPLVRSVCYCD